MIFIQELPYLIQMNNCQKTMIATNVKVFFSTLFPRKIVSRIFNSVSFLTLFSFDLILLFAIFCVLTLIPYLAPLF